MSKLDDLIIKNWVTPQEAKQQIKDLMYGLQLNDSSIIWVQLNKLCTAIEDKLGVKLNDEDRQVLLRDYSHSIQADVNEVLRERIERL